MTMEEILKRYWGYDSFRPLQREAIGALVDGRDSVVVLPTGGGKSLCYQLPALLQDDGLAVVVSPLISLMKDQVDGLVGQGVAAAYFNSSLTPPQQSAVVERLRAGQYRLLYVSPERLAGPAGERFCSLLSQSGVRYFAIDEAHCISQWGHDFRPEYRQLGQLRTIFPGLPIQALTATATPAVRHDIAAQLNLRDPAMLVGSFDRPNLIYRAKRRDSLRSQLRDVLDRHPKEAGIVYCISRKAVDRLAASLRDEGFCVVPYHAGLSDRERHHHQELFLKEQVEIVVATVAFGMGIDRSNVRWVIHAGAPKSVEHYQQEAGRAGRDGLEAECLLLYSPADFIGWRRMLASAGELSEAAKTKLRDLERFATACHCRHRALSEYFGQEYEREDCGACDWCLGELEIVDEPVILAQKILSCVLRLRQSWGVGQVIDVLRGRSTEKIRSRRHDQLSTYGLLEECSANELRGYIEQLMAQGWLWATEDRYPVLQVTPDGRRLLKADVECVLYRHKRPTKSAKSKPLKVGDSWEGVDRDLFEGLRELRLEIAREREVPPYVIFHDSTLRQLARIRPSDREQLLRVPGVGETKAEDLGARFLARIGEHCASHDLPRDVFDAPETAPASGKAERPKRRNRRSYEPGEVRRLASELFSAGRSVDEVAETLDRATSTVDNYLSEFVRNTQPDSIAAWVSDEELEKIRQARQDPTLSGDKLKPLYEHFGGEVSYNKLRIAFAFLNQREPLKPAVASQTEDSE